LIYRIKQWEDEFKSNANDEEDPVESSRKSSPKSLRKNSDLVEFDATPKDSESPKKTEEERFKELLQNVKDKSKIKKSKRRSVEEVEEEGHEDLINQLEDLVNL
jgi:hypothetical protein